MGEAGGKAPWEPIAILGGGGGPRPLDEGGIQESPGALPPALPEVAAQQAALDLERKRLELDRERLQLERERLELERARLSLSVPPAPPAASAPAPVGTPVPPTPTPTPPAPSVPSSGRRPARTARLASRQATPGTPQSHVAIAIVTLCAVGAGGLVVFASTRERSQVPAAPSAADAEAEQRLRSIELEERRLAATRAAEAELEEARRRQQLAQRETTRRAQEVQDFAAEEAAARILAAAALKAEVETLRRTLEQGEPQAFAAATARLRSMGKDRAANEEVERSARHALRDLEELRARCLARAVTSAHRLADEGSFTAATAKLEEARQLGLPLPASATEEAARWPARARAREEAAARSEAEQRRIESARDAALDEALARARTFYEARRVSAIRCADCSGGGCKACARGLVAQAAATVCAMLAPSAQQETGDWSSWSPVWPEAARGLLGPSLALRRATTCQAKVFADRVVTTTTVTWDTRPETTSEHVLVWVRERPDARLVIRGAEPPPVVVPLY